MLTLQVLGLGPLKNSILPLLAVTNSSDLKCSPAFMSLTVSQPHETHRFIAVLQMFDPFFTIFSTGGGGGGNFISMIPLDEFYLAIALCCSVTDDLCLTILLPQLQTYANLVFASSAGDFRYLIPLRMSPPQHGNAGQMEYELFVVIDGAVFREIVTQLSVDTAAIQVIATTSRVNLFVTIRGILREIVLTTERRQCMAGGFTATHGEIRLNAILHPLDLFLQASLLTNLVWFFRSSDWHTAVVFFTGAWTNILAYYAPNHMDYSTFWSTVHKLDFC